MDFTNFGLKRATGSGAKRSRNRSRNKKSHNGAQKSHNNNSAQKLHSKDAKRKARNSAGRVGGNIISVPSSSPRSPQDDIYASDNSPNRRTQTGRTQYRAPSPDGSETSRFSQECDASDAERRRYPQQEEKQQKEVPQKKRGQKQKVERDDIGDQMHKRWQQEQNEDDKRQKQEQKIEDKRQREKDKLAELQRRKDDHGAMRLSKIKRDAELECIDLEQDDNDERCFDGVPIDRVKDPRRAQQIDSLKQRHGVDDDGGYESVVPDSPKERGRRQKQKNNFRGKNHERSAMARSLSPKNNGQRMLKKDRHERGPVSPKNNGQRTLKKDRHERGHLDRQDHGNIRRGQVFSPSSGDPLDEAYSQQDINRTRGSTPMASSAARRDKVVEDVEESPEKRIADADWRRGRKGTHAMESVAHARLGDGKMTSNRRRRRTAEENKHDEAPSSGEKRKTSEYPSEQREDGPWSNKKQLSRKRLQDDAIDVDDSMMDQSFLSVASAPDRDSIGGDDDDDVDINGTLEQCGQFVNAGEYKRDSTPKSNAGSTAWEDDETMAAMMNDVANPEEKSGSSGRKHRNKSGKKNVTDMHKYLKNTKKTDNLVDESSPNSKDGRRDRGGDSSSNTLERRVTKNNNRDWMNTHGTTEHSYGKTGKTKSFRSKLKSQRGVFNERSESTLTMEPKKQKANKISTKTRRQSRLSFSNQTTNYIRPKTRKMSKAKESKDEVITIDDSSSEEDESSSEISHENVEEVSSILSVAEGRPRRTVADRFVLDAVRIAIGKKVVKSKCEVSFQFGTNNPYIMFSFWEKGKKSEHCVYLSQDDLKEVKYYVPDDDTADSGDVDDSMTVIAFRVTPNNKNSFDKYTNAYDQKDNNDTDQLEKRYISVEVRDEDEFRTLLVLMREHKHLGMWCTKESEIQSYELEKYTKALLEDSAKEKKMRRSARRTRSGGDDKTKESDNKLLLVYPFDVDEAALTEAVSGLKELAGDLLGVGQLPNAGTSELSDEGEGNGVKRKSSRTHYITIRQDDVDRLCPGEFLNDALVDFWMRWISREESTQPNSSVHFFTSHFMSTLKNDGPEAVASWTKKKNIDIFEKKLIFIPVNADLHWSLCVVVNPGLIAKNHDSSANPDEDHACILFLDSLKMHSSATYAKHICRWLNFEWKSLGKGKIGGTGHPFGKQMVLRSPKIPYQENGCDCGVFVCRYAYNLYIMRHQEFTWDDIEDKFKYQITKGPAFQFNMSEIARIREEIGTLIDKLSKHYLQLKEQEKVNKRAKRRVIENSAAAEQSDLSRNDSGDVKNASLGKVGALYETTTTTSDDDGATTAVTATGMVLDKGEDRDGDTIMASSEENVSEEAADRERKLFKSLGNDSEDETSAASVKEDASSVTATTASHWDGAPTDDTAIIVGTATWAVGKHGYGDSIMPLSDGKMSETAVDTDGDVLMLSSDEEDEQNPQEVGPQNSAPEVDASERNTITQHEASTKAAGEDGAATATGAAFDKGEDSDEYTSMASSEEAADRERDLIESLGNASGDVASAASGKEDASSETPTTASDEDCATTDGTAVGTSGKDEDGDTIKPRSDKKVAKAAVDTDVDVLMLLSSDEEKENILEVDASEKLAITQQLSGDSEPDCIVSHDI